MRPDKLLTLTPLKRAPRVYDFVAFDTEGDGSPDGFRLAATWDADGGRVHRTKKSLRDYLFSKSNLEKIILAANLEYDWAVAFQPFDDHHSILISDGRWLRAAYRDNSGHTWTAWDLQRIAPLSVADMGQVVGLEKYPTPPELLGLKKGARAHFTCDAHHRTDCLECYCLRDAEITYKFAVAYQRQLNNLGGQMKMTAASCSMDLFRRRFLDEEIEPTYPEKNDFARQALFGGRVEAFKFGTVHDIHAYDFNSLYPAVMRDLAVGRPGTYHHLNSTERLAARLDGFGVVRATLDIPATYIPVLPTRIRGYNYFVTGRVTGTWTFSEVKYALEHGARLVDSGELIFASETFQPFREFVDVLYAEKLRQQKAHLPTQVVVKLLLNSLWGKFAQRPDRELQLLVSPPPGFDYADYDGCTIEELAGREIVLQPIDAGAQPAYAQVPWAAEITAQARIRLHQHLVQADTRLFYCDTDSIHTDLEMETGDGLGELKLAEEYQRVVYLAPKEYGGLNTQGEFVGHAKGIPTNLQEEFLRRGHVRFTRPQHILEAVRARGRIAEWRTVMKQRRAHAPNRDHPALANYNLRWVDSRPYDAAAVPPD